MWSGLTHGLLKLYDLYQVSAGIVERGQDVIPRGCWRLGKFNAGFAETFMLRLDTVYVV